MVSGEGRSRARQGRRRGSYPPAGADSLLDKTLRNPLSAGMVSILWLGGWMDEVIESCVLKLSPHSQWAAVSFST